MERTYLSSVSMAGLRRIAQEVLPDDAYAYYMTGAGEEVTLRANELAWSNWSLLPQVLVDTADLAGTVPVLGRPASAVMVAPMAAQRLAHPDGESATVRAAAAGGHIVVLSMNASEPVENLTAIPGARIWMQLYLAQDEALTDGLIERARSAGAEALVLTVDAATDRMNYRRPHGDLVLPSWVPFPMRYGAPSHDRVTWDDIARLVASAGLPVVLKGVLRASDASRAADLGCAGVVVSNHGGRQVDGTIATADVVGEVAGAVRDRVEVYVDGGIRQGTDVLRALALGARAALVGRPVLWGLAAGGEQGVARVLELLDAELLRAARETGVADLSRVPGDLVRRTEWVSGIPESEVLRGR